MGRTVSGGSSCLIADYKILIWWLYIIRSGIFRIPWRGGGGQILSGLVLNKGGQTLSFLWPKNWFFGMAQCPVEYTLLIVPKQRRGWISGQWRHHAGPPSRRPKKVGGGPNNLSIPLNRKNSQYSYIVHQPISTKNCFVLISRGVKTLLGFGPNHSPVTTPLS